MSKNLTFKGTVNGVEGVFVDLDVDDNNPYERITEVVSKWVVPNITMEHIPSRHVLRGPAIERLFKFEQLGMEPEEIIGRLKAAEEYIKEKDEEIKLLKDTLETYRKVYNADKATINELTDKCENYKDTISKKDAELQRILYISTRNPYINDGFKTSRSVWAEQIVDSNDKLKVENDLLEMSNKTLANQLALANGENAKLKDKLKKAQGHIVTWRERAEKTWFECNTEIDGLKARNKDLMKMNDELEEKNKELTNKFIAAKNTLFIANVDLTSSLQASRKANDILKAENEKLSNENAVLNSLCNTSSNPKINDKLDILKTANQSLKIELSDLRNDNESLRSQIDGLKGLRFTLYEEIKELNKTIKQQEAEIHRLRDELLTNSSYDVNALKDLKARMETINHLSDPRTKKLDDIVSCGPRQ